MAVADLLPLLLPFSVTKILKDELQNILKEPIEGIQIKQVSTNHSTWNLILFGPPQTLYEGGYFEGILSFPPWYPTIPPTFTFVSPIFHPNVYLNGRMCLTMPESPLGKFRPRINVRSFLLNVISLLNEPETEWPANDDAAFHYVLFVKGESYFYEKRVRSLVERSGETAKEKGIKVPVTVEEYCDVSERGEVKYVDETYNSV